MDIFTDRAVMFAADWHGNDRWAVSVLRRAAKENVTLVYQVGDFGVWPGWSGEEYLITLQSVLEEFSIKLVVVPGNHEDYDQIDSWPLNAHGFIVNPLHPLIWYAPRGHVWEHSGHVVAALGGAFSVDVNHRTPRKSWWPQEAITKENVETLRKNLDGRSATLMLTHDVPDGTQPGPLVGKAFNLPADLEAESLRQRVLLREAVDIAQPSLLVHGHWHRQMLGVYYGATFRTECWGLDADGSLANFTIVDDFAGLLDAV